MNSEIANHKSQIRRITVVGAGTMGHGIAQVAAMAGYETRLMDADGEVLGSAWERIRSNLAGAVSRGKLTQAQADAALANLTPAGHTETAARDADLIIEA